MRRYLLVLVVAMMPALMGASEWRNRVQRKDEFLQQLKRDIRKIDKSVIITKELIGRSKGEKYLPDLHFRLAELYVAKSRLLYFRVLEEAGLEDKTAITAPESRLLKEQAITTYRRVLSEFPDYDENDKIRFYIAHELRELGEFEQMIKEYMLLVDQYPKSPLRTEAWLVLGDYYFDKADLDEAEGYYKQIIDSPESYVHNLARYKLAWCYINTERFKEAMALFEKVVLAPDIKVERNVQVDKQSRMNVRREALVDSAFCYTEVKKPQHAVAFYRRLASSRQDYLAALEKLARRYSIKSNPAAAADLYREAMAVSNDVEHNMELAFKVYEAVQQSKKRADTDKDVELLISAAARFRFSWRVTDEEKKQTLADVELITRDLATKLQTEAQRRSSAKLHAKAARAYKAYLSLFGDSEAAKDMTWNFAEALYESGEYVESGQVYEKLLKFYPPPRSLAVVEDAKPGKGGKTQKGKGGKPALPPKVPPKQAAKAGKNGAAAEVASSASSTGERKKAMYSAVISYFEALRKPTELSRLEQTLAREGLKSLGARFVIEFPKDEYAPQVKFNVARSYYETGDLDRAYEKFNAFAREYPSHKDAVASANLALDCLSQKEDFKSLAQAARDLATVQRLGDDGFKKELLAMANSADQQQLNVATIASEGNMLKVVEELKKTHKKGSTVVAQGMYQTFAVAKDRRDIQTMMEVGQQLLDDYGDTEYAQSVLPTLGEMSIQAGDFERGVGYYEEFSRRFPKDKAAMDLLAAATDLRLALGDRATAVGNLEKLYREGPPERRGEYALKLGKTAMETRNWRRAANAVSPLFSDNIMGPEAKRLAGEALLRAGDDAAAARLLQEALVEGARGDGDSRTEAAKASFLLGELVRKEFEPLQFGQGSDDNAVLEGKFTRLQQMDELYGQAVQLGDAGSAIGALYRLSGIYSHTAAMLDGAPMPEGLSAADQAAYKAALAERSGPMKQQSGEYIKACRQKAIELRVFNDYSRACLTGVAPPEETALPPPRVAVEIPGGEELRARLRQKPKDLDALMELGRRALGVGDAYAARVLFSRAEELDDSNAEAINGLGAAAYAVGDPQQAYFLFQRAIKANGSFAPAHLNLSKLLTEYGDTRGAAQEKALSGGAAASGPEIIRPVGGR